ncbi:hypothetical protein [Burkholderia cepacia]|uniref:hypothetical protein n=1 Tax=Burkholderia cepacia TaxID=292 RepID=UPI000AE02792|nr:hypothetical protein [Burkholderia cepacia]
MTSNNARPDALTRGQIESIIGIWEKHPGLEFVDAMHTLCAPIAQPAAAPTSEPSENDVITFRGDSLTLSGAQLLEALDFIAPDRDRDQLESELTFQRGAGHAGNGMYCWLTEYPEEGAFFVDGSTAIPAEVTLTAKEVAALHVLNEKLRHVDDMGPADEGWQSDKLNAAWTAVDAVLTRSPSGNGTKAGATNDTQVVTVDVRDLFAYLRAAWRDGQHYDREDFPDQADSWSAASDYANKTIEKWTGGAPARADARDELNAEHRDAIEWGITQALIIGDRLRVAQFASLLAVNPSRPKPRAELPHFPLVLRKMWSATDVQRWIDENIAPLITLTQAELDVITERRRQVEQEGWTPAHDDQYRDHELSCAAGCYAMYTLAYPAGDPPPAWPWAADWWKPTTHRRNLVKAGALIQAAIERLDRAGVPQ